MYLYIGLMVYVKCTRGLVSMLAHRMKCRCRQLIDCQLPAELNGVCLRYSKEVDGCWYVYVYTYAAKIILIRHNVFSALVMVWRSNQRHCRDSCHMHGQLPRGLHRDFSSRDWSKELSLQVIIAYTNCR